MKFVLPCIEMEFVLYWDKIIDGGRYLKWGCLGVKSIKLPWTIHVYIYVGVGMICDQPIQYNHISID